MNELNKYIVKIGYVDVKPLFGKKIEKSKEKLKFAKDFNLTFLSRSPITSYELDDLAGEIISEFNEGMGLELFLSEFSKKANEKKGLIKTNLRNNVNLTKSHYIHNYYNKTDFFSSVKKSFDYYFESVKEVNKNPLHNPRSYADQAKKTF